MERGWSWFGFPGETDQLLPGRKKTCFRALWSSVHTFQVLFFFFFLRIPVHMNMQKCSNEHVGSSTSSCAMNCHVTGLKNDIKGGVSDSGGSVHIWTQQPNKHKHTHPSLQRPWRSSNKWIVFIFLVHTQLSNWYLVEKCIGFESRRAPLRVT